MQKDKEIQRKGKELDGKIDELLQTRDAVKNFVSTELHKSNNSLEEAQLAHSNAPSRYSTGLVEIAKGTHAENKELLQRLASVVGVDVNASNLNVISEHEEKALATPPASPKAKPRKVSPQCIVRRCMSNSSSLCTKVVISTDLLNSLESLLRSPFKRGRVKYLYLQSLTEGCCA